MTRHGIELDSEEIKSFCRKWKIKELSVFGSILRDDFRADSDVDFLAEFGEEAEWDLSEHVDMEEELGKILGRSVDLIDRPTMVQHDNWLLRKAILSSEEKIYAG